MSDRNHRLEIHTRGDGSISAPVSGQCSCGQFEIRNMPRSRVRELHAEHLQEELGPDAQDARERVV